MAKRRGEDTSSEENYALELRRVLLSSGVS